MSARKPEGAYSLLADGEIMADEIKRTAGVQYRRRFGCVTLNYSAEIAPTGQAASHAPHERQASLSIS